MGWRPRVQDVSAATDGLVCDKAGETSGISRLPCPNIFATMEDRRRCDLSGQLCYDHLARAQFIFLKTRKTAGTSIELALSDLCGARDIITPLTETDEALRANGRGAQNWRLHGWWQVPPLLATPLLQIHRAGLRFLQSYRRKRPRRCSTTTSLAQLFQIRLRPQSLGPASFLVSPPLSPQGQEASRSLPPLFIRTDGRASTITRSIRLAGSLRSILSDASKL